MFFGVLRLQDDLAILLVVAACSVAQLLRIIILTHSARVNTKWTRVLFGSSLLGRGGKPAHFVLSKSK